MTAELSEALAELHLLVRAAWAESLGHRDFTDDDNFFSVGGHSMGAVRLMARLSAATGTRLPMRLLFEHQTVRELTDAVRQRLAAARGGH